MHCHDAPAHRVTGCANRYKSVQTNRCKTNRLAEDGSDKRLPNPSRDATGTVRRFPNSGRERNMSRSTACTRTGVCLCCRGNRVGGDRHRCPTGGRRFGRERHSRRLGQRKKARSHVRRRLMMWYALCRGKRKPNTHNCPSEEAAGWHGGNSPALYRRAFRSRTYCPSETMSDPVTCRAARFVLSKDERRQGRTATAPTA